MATSFLATSDLEAAVIDHVARYRLTVVEALQTQPALAQPGSDQLKQILKQLCRQGVLDNATLYLDRSYFYLAPMLPTEGRKLLSESVKIRRYAMLAFCCLGATPRTRLLPTECEAHCPELYHAVGCLDFYVSDSTANRALGVLRVDSGGRGRWDRVLEKCRRDIIRLQMDRQVRAMIDDGQLEYTLVTALPQKVHRLQQAIVCWSDIPLGVMRLCAVPDLVNLIAPSPY